MNTQTDSKQTPAPVGVGPSDWFGGGRVPKTQGWEKVRTGRATSRKWVNYGAGCWVTLNRGEVGVHVGYSHEYQGFKEGMTAAEAVEWCRAKWAAKVAQN